MTHRRHESRPTHPSRLACGSIALAVCGGLAVLVSASHGCGLMRPPPAPATTAGPTPDDGSADPTSATAAVTAGDAPAPASRPGTVRIPAGPFVMGTPVTETGRFSDEGPQHELTVAAFEMHVTPVTVAAFAQRMDDIAHIEPRARWFRDGEQPSPWPGTCNLGTGRRDHPMNCVDWFAARAYCHLQGGDLPTEAEWEYAARAGTSTPFWWGDGFDDNHAIGSVHCGVRGCRGGTESVVSEGPRCNPWGVCDMIGQVWEWTRTAYVESLGTAAHDLVSDDVPETPVHRGGAWLNHEVRLFRSALRGINYPKHGLTGVGFRCVWRTQP